MNVKDLCLFLRSPHAPNAGLNVEFSGHRDCVRNQAEAAFSYIAEIDTMPTRTVNGALNNHYRYQAV